jgi:hypothetical protein
VKQDGAPVKSAREQMIEERRNRAAFKQNGAGK